jgi:hypothetical protein
LCPRRERSPHRWHKWLSISIINPYKKTAVAALSAIAVNCASTANAAAAGQPIIVQGIAYSGFTGIFHTPSAAVLKKGTVDIGYSNQLEFVGKYTDGHNFTFSAGLFDGLEVSGRIASNTIHDNELSFGNSDQIRDLSFNVKYQIPYIPKDWLSLAFGAKDVGGTGNYYEAFYAVASKDWQDFRFSAGVGSSDTPLAQLNGVFAGIEYQPLRWITLLAEHDSAAFNLGARVTVPKEWLADVATISFNTRFYSNTNVADNSTYWGLNIRVPLNDVTPPKYVRKKSAREPKITPLSLTNSVNQTQQRQLTQTHVLAAPSLKSTSPIGGTVASSSQDQYNNNIHLHRLKRALVSDGYENISVGLSQSNTIIVAFENSVFNRNDIDALGLVLGRIAEHFPDGKNNFSVRLSKLDIPLLQVRGSVDNYRRFLSGNKTPNLLISTQFNDQEMRSVTWAGRTKTTSPYLVPRLSFSPSLTSTYATELGVYDYSLALQADLHLPLWQGGGINVTGQVNVANSDSFEKNKVFSNSRQETGIRRVIAYQTIPLPFNVYNQTQFGLFKDAFDYAGITNESMWQSPKGHHKLSAKLGFFRSQDVNHDKRSYSIYSYRYLWAKQDISFHVSGGQFWNGDTGYKLETKFWFGDANIALSYSDADIKKVGIEFSIPLSPRKDMSAGNWQIKGADNWSHGIKTRIGERENFVDFNSAVMQKSSIDLNDTFFNQDRLSSSYIYAHLSRLKEAFDLYK